jgi:hypothetical protein
MRVAFETLEIQMISLFSELPDQLQSSDLRMLYL